MFIDIIWEKSLKLSLEQKFNLVDNTSKLRIERNIISDYKMS